MNDETDRMRRRFWPKVNLDGPTPSHRPELGPCWIWIGTISRFGYGRFCMPRNGSPQRTEQAHRVAWYLDHERWPNPCCLHMCDNKGCVRITHLFEGTDADNVRDMCRKRRSFNCKKTHCPRGHEYTVENTHLYTREGVTGPVTGRWCKACRRLRHERERNAKRSNETGARDSGPVRR
jgi:hypothetical protein